MKFYFAVLMAAVMSLSLTACGDDDDKSNGGGTNPSYIGQWIDDDTDTKFSYLELAANTWTRVEYRIHSDYYNGIETRQVTKEVSSGGLSVNGNQIILAGSDAPSNTGTYTVSGNTLTVTFTVNGQAENFSFRRISTADDAAKLAGWEALYKAQNL